MERSRFGVWARRVAIGLVLVLVATGAAVSWRMMNLVESELLTPGSLVEPVEVEIISVTGTRVMLRDVGGAAVEGVWGVKGSTGYAQMTRVISRGPSGVERGLAVVSGSFMDGEVVQLDPNAFPSDPRTAHGLPFEEIRVPGEHGVNPAWLITGEVDTWVVFVHGKEADGRAQSLRALPTFRKLGFPVLVITYRNDASGEAGNERRYTWGLDEWRDLEAALDTATLRGADEFVLIGHDMGASIIATFLRESVRAPDVRGVVFDSAVLDFEALADELAADRGIPGYLAAIGKGLARIRFGLEWSRLDHLGRVDEFDPSLPILMMHGSADAAAPIEKAESFAAALSGVTLERFEGASHGALWNSASVRYEELLADFLIAITPELLPER